MGVASMRAADHILFAQVRAYTRGYCFFADVQVDKARDFGLPIGTGGSLLEAPYKQHLPIKGPLHLFVW
jgi:hypothetical protein